MLKNLENTGESFGDDTSSEAIDKKQAELFQQEEGEAQAETEITREQLSLSKRIFNWRTILPLVIVLGALIFLALPNINLQKTGAVIRNANILFFLAAFGVYYLTFPLRALRWRILLENVGFTKANGVTLPKFWKIVEIIFISFFANVIVPAKLGDMYRAYLLRQETGVSATRSFGTVLAERLLDLIVLLLLCIPAVMISLQEKLPWQVQLVLTITLVAVIVGVVGLFMLHLLRTRIEQLVPLRFRHYYNHLQEGMLGSFRRLPVLTGLTICTWVGEAMRFFFVALALSLFSGNLLHIISAAFFIGLVEALLTAIPFTGGGIGLVEGGMAAMIILLNPQTLTTGKSLAAAAIVLDRAISFLSILLIGFIVFMIAFGKQARKQTKKS